MKNKREFVENNIRQMSLEEFTDFVKSVNEYDIWSNTPFGVDPCSNISDRMEVMSTFEDEDLNMYFDVLNK